MRRLLVLALCVTVLVLAGCGWYERDYVIEVTGDYGVPFTGVVGGMSGESFASRSVSGRTPAEYKFTGSSISVVFQKSRERGILEVRILVNERVIASGKTGAAYGVVSIAR